MEIPYDLSINKQALPLCLCFYVPSSVLYLIKVACHMTQYSRIFGEGDLQHLRHPFEHLVPVLSYMTL